MTEASKTLVFLACGLVALAAGYMSASAPGDFDPAEDVGKLLNEFDVDDPRDLKIVKASPSGLELVEFEVAQRDGRWIIPSKQGYPADAAEQMAAAATGLINREILRVESAATDDHESLGVLNPSEADLDGEVEGVGIRVVMNDADGKPLVDMIIGNEVKDAPGQRYVRNANQDIAYVAKIDSENLKTSFEEWIEDDLLQLDPFRIKDVSVFDYSAQLSYRITPDGRRIPHRVDWDPHAKMLLSYDKNAAQWTARELISFNSETAAAEPMEIAEDEELDQDALREFRNGLDDLLIVDVERKPAGLSADLKGGDDFLNNRESVENLEQRGFAVARLTESDKAEVISSEGQLICTMDNGVEYILRFGNPASGESDADGEPQLNRYLFVSVQFNEAAVEKPELQDAPPLPEGVQAPAEEEADQADDAARDEDPAGDDKVDSAEEEEEEEEADAEESTGEAAGEEPDETETNDAPAEATSPPASEDAGEPMANDDDAGLEDADASADDAIDMQALLAERERILAANQRSEDQYQATLEDGRQRVQELNERFGDWYYVISEDVYKQIHLSLDRIVKKKEAAAPPAPGGAFPPPTSVNPLRGLPEISLGGDSPGDDDAGDDAE